MYPKGAHDNAADAATAYHHLPTAICLLLFTHSCTIINRPGGLMAEEQTSDQTSREMLEQLAARIEHLERLMQAQTTRLYAVERRMGIEPAPRRPLYESLTDEREESRGAAPDAAPREPARPADAGKGQTQTRPEAGR